MKQTSEARYSKEYSGDKGNYNWSASVMASDGYIRIEQKKISEDRVSENPIEVVLLSPSQWRAVREFVARRRK